MTGTQKWVVAGIVAVVAAGAVPALMSIDSALDPVALDVDAGTVVWRRLDVPDAYGRVVLIADTAPEERTYCVFREVDGVLVPTAEVCRTNLRRLWQHEAFMMALAETVPDWWVPPVEDDAGAGQPE